MNLSKPQLIVVAAAGAIVLILALIILGVLPGLQTSSTNPAKIKATLNLWGVGDTAEDYTDAISAFKTTYPNVIVNYRGFANEGDYDSALLNALAENKGPDIFMVRNTDIAQNAGKIAPALSTTFSTAQLNQMFPQVVSQDLVYQNQVGALPLSVDTLALVYNRNLFDQAAVPLPSTWKNWDDFLANIPKLVKKDQSGAITQAAAALGTAGNVANAPDILYMLMLQSGTPTNVQNQMAFNSSQSVQALDFYTQFSRTNSQSYTWNSKFQDSLDAFANGDVAMIFDYASDLPQIKSKNAYLNFEVAPVPQLKGATLAVTYPSYWAYAVSRQSSLQSLAWNFIITMTTQNAAAQAYSQKTQKPPALNSLIYQYQNDPVFGVFARQALTARSWFQGDRNFIDRTISDMIDSVAGGQISSANALSQAQDKINQYLSQKTF